MTNKEAIKIINDNRDLFHSLGMFNMALDYTIKALERIDLIDFNLHALKTLCNEPKKKRQVDKSRIYEFS